MIYRGDVFACHILEYGAPDCRRWNIREHLTYSACLYQFFCEPVPPAPMRLMVIGCCGFSR